MDKVQLIEKLNNTLLWIEGPFWTFLKKNWKIVAIVILALLLLQTCNKEKQIIKQSAVKEATAEYEKQQLENTVKTWTDANGELHYRMQSMLEYGKKMEGKYIDSIAKILNIKSKNIESIAETRVDTRLDAKIKVVKQYIDTCIDKNGDTLTCPSLTHFLYTDAWMEVSGDINNSIRPGNVFPNVDSIHISSVDTLKAVNYWQRDKILGLRIGKINEYVDIQNSNPHNRIYGAKKLELKQPKYKYSLGVGATYGWQLPTFKRQISVGITLQRTLIRF